MRLVDNRVLRPHVELPAGSFQLECVETDHPGRISFSFLNTLVVIEEKGQYRFDATQRRLTVVEGSMTVRFDGKSLTVRRGETVVVGEEAQSEPVEPVRVLF
jgi:mannose-6-phosphate isomerase-like protein (cupin superfamily)